MPILKEPACIQLHQQSSVDHAFRYRVLDVVEACEVHIDPGEGDRVILIFDSINYQVVKEIRDLSRALVDNSS